MRTIGFTIFLFFLILSSLSLPGQASLSHTKVSDDALPTENGPSFPSDSMYLATGQALNQPDLTIDDFLDALYPLLDAERSWLYILSDRGYLLDEHFAEAVAAEDAASSGESCSVFTCGILFATFRGSGPNCSTPDHMRISGDDPLVY